MKKNQFHCIVMGGILLCLFLIGCGGGGGGGSDSNDGRDSYSGLTGQAKISESNAQAIAEMTISSIFGDAAQLPFISGAVPSPSGVGAMSVQLERNLLHMVQEKRWAADGQYLTGAAGSETEEGECGGSVTYSGLDEERVGNLSINGSVTFNNYCECEIFSSGCANRIISDGEMSASGQVVSQYDDEDEEYYLVSGQLSYGMDGMHIKIYENSSLQADIFIDGTVDNSWADSDDYVYEETMKMNLVRTEQISDKTIWMKDLSIRSTQDWYAYESTITASGRIYYEDYGYVEIQTPSTLIIDMSDSIYPYDGILILSGEKGAKIRITFSYDSYSIESDVNGDGVYEHDLGEYDG